MLTVIKRYIKVGIGFLFYWFIFEMDGLPFDDDCIYYRAYGYTSYCFLLDVVRLISLLLLTEDMSSLVPFYKKLL